MATYKVLQDIEAEDKLVGPLTLRQFIYAGISVANLYLSYFLAAHGLIVVMPVFLIVALASGFFAFPWGGDQPTEVWALAKIRFFLKPRKRIWDQSGVKELVTITAPKHIVEVYTNGLSETEVKSRLRALADTIDSRGWAIKNANINMMGQATYSTVQSSDRLVAPLPMPQPVVGDDIEAADDMMDEQNNEDARRLSDMISKSTQAHHNRILESLKDQPKPPAPAPQQKPPENFWFLNQPAAAARVPNDMVTFNTQVVTPGTPEEIQPVAAPAAPASALPPESDAEILAELDAHKQVAPDMSYYGHLHTIMPLSQQQQQMQQSQSPQPIAPPQSQPTQDAQQSQAQPAAPAEPPVTPANQAAILKLANNDDLNIATIAREAERTASQDEVVIKLH